MPVRRLRDIPGFAIDEVAAAAGNDRDVLRMENLDTDLPPPQAALEATRAAIGQDEANSYLPFTGSPGLCKAVAARLNRQTGNDYSPSSDVLITCGGTEGLFDALLAITDPGDEVVLTDPTYAGMINRVRLAGAVPRLAPFSRIGGEWRLDTEEFVATLSDRTRALFIMNPSMPSGAVLTRHEWQLIADTCIHRDLWLLYNAAMEGILYDGREVIHPAGFDGMRDRTITVGSVSKECRMIGWRIGWVVGPDSIVPDIARAHIYNVVTATGLTQTGAAAALNSPASDLSRSVAEWERRRDAVVAQLERYDVTRAAGGWSLLVDVSGLGLTSGEASRLLLTKGKVAATPMKHWGVRNADQFVRLVFSNEPLHRLHDLGERFDRALR
jgi:aspartate/methionine/tyrosine aminotransferase